MGATGLEPVAYSPEKTRSGGGSGAESGAESGDPAPIDADLRRLIDAWPTLPDPVRAGIIAMVKAVANR